MDFASSASPRSPMSSGISSSVANDSNSRPQQSQNEVNYHQSSHRHHTTNNMKGGITTVVMSDDEHAISVEAVCQRYETHLGNG
jgi:hypothetical protein